MLRWSLVSASVLLVAACGGKTAGHDGTADPPTHVVSADLDAALPSADVSSIAVHMMNDAANPVADDVAVPAVYDAAVLADTSPVIDVADVRAADAIPFDATAITSYSFDLPSLMWLNGERSFQLLANDGDGHPTIVKGVAWETSNPAVVTIRTFGDYCEVKAVGVGTAEITARVGSLIVSQRTVLVTSAKLESMMITPSSLDIHFPDKGHFVLTGSFDDGTMHDITNVALWSPNVFAEFGPVHVVAGEVKATQLGTTEVKATLLDLTAIAQVTLDPGNPSTISVGTNPAIHVQGTDQLYAQADYGQGQTLFVTSAVTWYSEDPNIAAFVDPSSPGLLTGKQVGTTKVYVVLGNLKSAPIGVTVTPE